MAVFLPEETRWDRIDYSAIAGQGFVSVSEADASDCRRWLVEHAYSLAPVDCTAGFESICSQFSRMFRFEEEFGYEYKGHSLDALRDGFEFDVPDEGGVVLELARADCLWKENPEWLGGLISIATEHTSRQIAVGRRFFTTLIIPPKSEMIGWSAFDVAIPVCWWRPGPLPLFR